MRRKLTTAIPLGATAIALCVSGCGAGSRAGASNVDCDVEAPTEETTVDVLAYSSPSMDPFSDAMATSCSEVDHLTVEHSPVDFAGQLEKAQLSLSQDEGTYDLVEVYSGTLPEYADQGWLEPLDDFYAENADRYDLDDLDPSLMKFAKYEGHIYTLPMAVNVHVMAYREDILDDLGIAPPQTMNELVAAAEKIEESGKVEHPLGLTFSADADITTAFNNSLASMGATWVDPATDEVLLDTPEAAAAVQSLKDLMPYLPPDAMSADSVSISTQMQNGDTAMSIMYTGSMAAIDDPAMSEYAGKFGFAPAPSVEPGGGPWATLNLDGFSVAANSEVDEELLAQVAAVGTGPDAAQEAGRLTYPVRSSVRNDPELSKDAAYWEAGQASIDQGAHPYPAEPYFVPLQTAVRPYIADAVSGELPIEEALAQAQAAAEDVVAEYEK